MVSNTTLRQNVWETVYDVINGITFSTDDSVTVTAAFIDKEQTLPQVVVNPVDVTYNQFSFGAHSFDNTFTILVDIFTKKNKDKDIIADDLMSAIIGNSSFTDFHLSNVSESNALETPTDGLKYRLKTITLNFVRRG